MARWGHIHFAANSTEIATAMSAEERTACVVSGGTSEPTIWCLDPSCLYSVERFPSVEALAAHHATFHSATGAVTIDNTRGRIDAMPTDIKLVQCVPAGCNTNNHHEYAPFRAEQSTLRVDPGWFATLTALARREIEMVADQHKVQISFDSVPVPHHWDRRNETLFYDVYAAHNRQFDHERWWPLVAAWTNYPLSIVPLSADDLEVLTSRCYDPSCVQPLSVETEAQLRLALKNSFPAFVKTGRSSGKNDHRLSECYTYEDVLTRLTRSADHIKYYTRCIENQLPACAVVTKWNDDINPKNEYRVIVHGGKVRGISQQKWYKSVYRTQHELVQAAKMIIAAWDDHLSQLLPFQSVVLDIWIDNERANLIECNPGGRWASSGSSLFHWINDEIEHSDVVVMKWY